jgi:uncharacterized protein (TIGR00369 family)
MKEILKYSGCFVCGEKNIHGLKARFFYNGEEAYTEIETARQFEGYRDIYHGGIISTILDEVMIKAILAVDRYAVTAEMTIRFNQPVPIDKKLRFTGRVIKNKGRIFLTEGDVTDAEGNLYASATGKYVEADESMKQQLLQSID